MWKEFNAKTPRSKDAKKRMEDGRRGVEPVHPRIAPMDANFLNHRCKQCG
jgi:hypothetical protein